MSSYFDGKQLFQAPTVEQHSSHMVMSNVYKDEKTSYLTIDSTFSTNTDLSNNMGEFNIELMAPITEVKSIEVISANIPLSWYNISKQLENSFFKYNGTLYRVSNGEYSELTLIDAINNAIQGSNPCIYDANTRKISFNNVSHLEFDVDKYGNTNGRQTYHCKTAPREVVTKTEYVKVRTCMSKLLFGWDCDNYTPEGDQAAHVLNVLISSGIVR